MVFQWKTGKEATRLTAGGKEVLSIPAQQGCADSFEQLEEGAWRWVRSCEAPVDQMKMTIKSADAMRYWQVPSVNYNGNGWGSGAQYSGYSLNDEPWTYSWHRVAIPACTYAESDEWAVSLFGEEKGGMSCSIWAEEDKACQALIWPEQEGPKVLFKRCWMDPFMGAMEPATTFTAILRVRPARENRKGYHDLLDFAWRFFDREVKMERSPEEIIRLDTLYFRQMWTRRYDGLTGFDAGMHWNEQAAAFLKAGHSFELGWVGQNPSVACTLMREYKKTGEEDLKDKALSVLDSWMKYGRLENGSMYARLVCDPNRLDSILNGDIPMTQDACNLGVGATYLFKAAKLAEACGAPRPEYREAALGLSDFAVRVQCEDGEFAKSWFMDGTIDSAHGSVGVFMAIPLFGAYEASGDKKYLDSALKAFDFYYGEFCRTGYTTAGALDSNCIDKESAAPLLRTALMCYHATKDKKYVTAAEDIAYYLATWQWHYTVDFPRESMAGQTGFDTFGCTSVSAAHNALDFYGIYYVPEYLELAELTGKDMWRSRARALWYNGIQLISDGTLVIKGRVRPAGSQDESVRHTRWGRPDKKYFTTSEWLTSWQGAYRQVALDMIDDWDALR
jgi:hypothetical protein